MNWKANGCALIALVLLLLFCNLAWADEGQPVRSRFLGGNNIDFGYDIIIGDSSFVHVGEGTRSNDFPITSGAYGQANDGSYSASHSDGAEFTGTFSDTAVDYNGNGLYDFLSATVEVEIIDEGNYFIWGSLGYGDTFITSRRSIYSAVGEVRYYLSEPPGVYTAALNFSGEDIRNSGIDGNYRVGLVLEDGNGAYLDTVVFQTQSYDHTDFGEIPASITGLTDYGLDSDGDGLYDYLVAEVSIESIPTTSYVVKGYLITKTCVITASKGALLNPGANTVSIYLDGTEIRQSGEVGPYILKVSLSEENFIKIESKEFTTSPYSHTDFQRNVVEFSDIYNDYGTDSDVNGLFDFLTVEVGLDVEVAGDYKITGWLKDSTRLDICHTNTTTYLDVGSQTATLNFDGTRIRKHGVDGPYLVSHIAIHTEYDILINNKIDAYLTSPYSYLQFEKLPSE